MNENQRYPIANKQRWLQLDCRNNGFYLVLFSPDEWQHCHENFGCEMKNLKKFKNQKYNKNIPYIFFAFYLSYYLVICSPMKVR